MQFWLTGGILTDPITDRLTSRKAAVSQMDMMLYPPTDWTEFQRLCLRYFRWCHGMKGLTPYGRNGQKQHGIDLLQNSGPKPWSAIQCKLKEGDKGLDVEEIRRDIASAEKADFPISTFCVATTAQNHTELVDLATSLNTRPDKKFDVTLVFWDEIRSDISALGFLEGYAVYSPEAQKELKAQIALHASTTPTQTADDFASINKLIDDNKIEAAEFAIQQQKDPENDPSLAPDVRSSLLRLRGRLAFAKLEYAEAARLFELAHADNPSLIANRLNRLLAMALDGDRPGAFAGAAALANEGEASAALAERLVTTAATLTDIAPFRTLIASFESESESVNVGLVHLALASGELETAAEAAERALDIAPESPHALFASGAVLHQRLILGVSEDVAIDRKNAFDKYKAAIQNARSQRYIGITPEILNNKARLHAAFGEAGEAVSSAEQATHEAIHKGPYAAEAVRCCLRFDQMEVAEQQSSYLDTTTDEGRLLKGLVSYSCTQDRAEKLAHIQALLEMLTTSAAEEAACHAVQFAIAIDAQETVSPALGETFCATHPLTCHTLRSWIALSEDDTETAGSEAKLAIESVADGALDTSIEVLARVLVGLERFDDALLLVERIYTPGILDARCRLLLACASRLGYHAVVIRACEELRSTGSLEREMLLKEINLLLRYDLERASSLAIEEGEKGDAVLQSVANYIATTRRLPLPFAKDRWKIPDPSELTPQSLAVVLAPLLATDRIFEAVQFAYRAFRTHSNDPGTHSLFFGTLLQHADSLKIPTTETVTPESAVRLRSLKSKQDRWTVIEDDSPQALLHETSSDSPAGYRLIGRAVGEVLEGLTNGVGSEKEEIVEILHKWLYRARDIGERFRERFPDSSMLQAIKVAEDGEYDFSDLVQMGLDQQQRSQKVLDIYCTQPLATVAIVASAFNRPYVGLYLAMADSQDTPLNCVQLNASVFEEGVECASSAANVVLDLSAILSISQLELWEHVVDQEKFIVPYTAVHALESWLSEVEDIKAGDSGLFSVDPEGLPVVRAHSTSETEEWKSIAESMLNQVKTRCRVVNAMGTAALREDQRSVYEACLGVPNIDAVLVAQEHRAVLWTDEATTGAVSTNEFGVARIWTQAALEAWLREGQLPRSQYNSASAWLVHRRYRSTRWNGGTLLEAARIAGWDAHASPFSGCLKELSRCFVPPVSKMGMVVDFLTQLADAGCPGLKRTAVMQAVIRAWSDRLRAREVMESAGKFFPYQPKWAMEVAQELEYWLDIDPKPFT